MVSAQAEEDINIIFMVIFVPLLALNVFNLIKLKGYRLPYFSLVMFDQLRIVGNTLLVAAFETEKKDGAKRYKTTTSLYTGGYVMQSIGYSMLFSSTLYLFQRAVQSDKGVSGGRRSLEITALHALNIVSTVLLIVGIVDSKNIFSTDSGIGSVAPTAKAGSYLYCAITAILAILVIGNLCKNKSLSRTARNVLKFCVGSMFFLCVRVGYSAYRVQITQFIDYNVWAHLVCQDIVEVVVVVIYTALAFHRLHHPADNKVVDDGHSATSEESLKAQIP